MFLETILDDDSMDDQPIRILDAFIFHLHYLNGIFAKLDIAAIIVSGPVNLTA